MRMWVRDGAIGLSAPDCTDPMFGLNNNKDLPYDAIWFVAEVECYAEKEGLETSPVTHFMWRIERPAWHDFAHDVLHEGGDNFPTVHRYFDNFQAAAYYIEGSERGILFDGLMPTNTTTTLIDRVIFKWPPSPMILCLVIIILIIMAQCLLRMKTGLMFMCVIVPIHSMSPGRLKFTIRSTPVLTP